MATDEPGLAQLKALGTLQSKGILMNRLRSEFTTGAHRGGYLICGPFS